MNLLKHINFTHKLGILTLKEPEFSDQIEYDFCNKGGVYILRCIYPSNRPYEIPRCLGNDKEGILYIGMAKLFSERTGNLAKSISNDHCSADHSAGAYYKETDKFIEVYPRDHLYVSFIIADNPRDKEEPLLAVYKECFGEVPPLNSQG